MSIIILIPGLVCLIALMRGGVQRAFLGVYLPVLLLFPEYYFWKVPHIPEMTFVEATMFPIGVAVLGTYYSRWRFSRSDLWMLLFVFSAGSGDFRVGDPNTAIYDVFHAITEGLFPYMAGKMLIEQAGLREKTVQKFVWLLFGGSIVSMYEYFFRQNLFHHFWTYLFPNQWTGWSTQLRWGFGRLAGPYAQSELAGLITFTGLVMALWFVHRDKKAPVFSDVALVSLKNNRLLIAVLAVTLFMTQARGPWIGTILALSIASIGLAKKPIRRALVVMAVGLLIGVPGYSALKDYSSGPRTDYGSEKETAQYRQQLMENYMPLVQQGGAWGWGVNFPRIGGQASIDNEYLLVSLIQGYAGLTAFVLLILEAAFSLARRGFTTTIKRDRHFIFSLLGIVLGISFTLATVFLGMQTYPLFFLLIGWSQAIGMEQAESPAATRVVTQRIFVEEGIRIYT